MSSGNQTSSPNLDVGVALAIVAGIVIYPLIDAIVLGIKVGLYTMTVTLFGGAGLFFIGRGIYHGCCFLIDRKRDKARFRENVKQLNELLRIPLRKELLKPLQERESIFRNAPFFVKEESEKCLEPIKVAINKIEQQIANELQKAEEDQQREEQKVLQKIEQVFQAFKRQGHTKIIPESYKFYSEGIIQRAREQYDTEAREQYEWKQKRAHQQEHRKEAFLFVWNNHGLPSNYGSISIDKRQYYDEALELDKQRLLKQEIDQLREKDVKEKHKQYVTNEDYTQLSGSAEGGKAREAQLLQKDFYFTSELTQNEKNFLLKFHAYKTCKISNFGDGFIYVMYHSQSRERPIHFCTKHLFARLHPSGRVEVRDWYKNEIDVVFAKGTRKFAVEIERGTNKPEYLREKVSELYKSYTKTILVVPRDKLNKYTMYHDGQKVFVFTSKQAKGKLLEWLQ